MELRHLRYFLTVAEFLHFGRAARQLGIAQPSLSHQISQLETELQTQLFERSKKRVQLTESGVLFLKETRQILEHVDRAAVIARTGRPGKDRIRVGFGYWTDLSKLCAAIKRFDVSHPNVYVELYDMSVQLQIAALREGKMDVGFVLPPVADPELHSESLFSEPFAVAMPKGHRLAARRAVDVAELKAERIIMPLRESLPFFYDLTLKVFQDAGFVPNVHHAVGYPTIVLGLVATGLGVSLVPASVRRLHSAGIVFAPLRPKSRMLETSLAWRRSDTSSVLPEFLKVVRDVASSRR